jgi:hypothetical protein
MSASMTLDELIEEMLEFGIRLDVAERVAPAFLWLENDPRGFRLALQEDAPLIAERIGVARRH